MKYRHDGKIQKIPNLNVILYFIPIPVFLLALSIGAYGLSVPEVIDIILYKISGYTIFNSSLSAPAITALINVRLPRVILSMLVGAALSVSGASFQSLMKNPLVEPYTLGVSSGAAFGAALSMSFLSLPIQISAFVFAMLSITICYSIAQQKGDASVISLILAGIIISSIFTAALSVVQLMVDPLKLQGLVFWTMGAFYTATWEKVFSSIGFMGIGFILIFVFRWKLNILSLGDQEAKMLGVNPKIYKGIIIFAATLLASSSVAVTGIISLVCLMIPHICRMLFGADNKRLIPLSMAFGASYLTLVDIFSRNLFTFEIPVGIFTTFLGAPFFILLLRKVRNAGWN